MKSDRSQIHFPLSISHLLTLLREKINFAAAELQFSLLQWSKVSKINQWGFLFCSLHLINLKQKFKEEKKKFYICSSLNSLLQNMSFSHSHRQYLKYTSCQCYYKAKKTSEFILFQLRQSQPRRTMQNGGNMTLLTFLLILTHVLFCHVYFSHILIQGLNSTPINAYRRQTFGVWVR